MINVSFASRIIILLFTSLIIIGCQSGPEEKIQLRLQLKKGEMYNLSQNLTQNITQKISGIDQELKQTLNLAYSMHVTAIDAEGSAMIDITYTTAQFTQDSSSGHIEYDSNKHQENIPDIAKGYAALLDKTFSMKLSVDGKISPVEQTVNLENLQIRDTFENFWSSYPETPVGWGDIWRTRDIVTKGYPVILDNTWQLISLDETQAIIEVKTKAEANKDAGPVILGNTELLYDLSGNQEGLVKVSRTSGMVFYSKIKQSFSGNVTVRDRTGNLSAMTWPIAIDTVITQVID